jgi:hypothetical protein
MYLDTTLLRQNCNNHRQQVSDGEIELVGWKDTWTEEDAHQLLTLAMHILVASTGLRLPDGHRTRAPQYTGALLLTTRVRAASLPNRSGKRAKV